jgi:nicotinamidase-related amidase
MTRRFGLDRDHGEVVMGEHRLIVGRPALLVIDMQEGAYGDDSGIPRMGGFAVRVERVQRMIERFRSLGHPVIFFAEEHRRSRIDFGRELDGDEGIHCLEGDPGTAIAADLDVQPDDIVISKRRYSCFFSTDLDLLLRSLRVDTVVLVGELTDVCVQYTFADAHQHDYFARVVEDCCGGSSVTAHRAALEAMSYLQSAARTVASEVDAELLAGPRRPD